MSAKSINPGAWGAILAVAFLWGGSFLSTRIALDELPVASIVAFRIAGGATVLWLYVALARLPVPRFGRAWADLALSGLIGNVAPFLLIAWGQQYIASGLAAILNAATAIFGVGLAAVVLEDERMTPQKAMGLAVGFAGVIAVIGPGALGEFDLHSLGQLAMLAAAAFYAATNVWARLRLSGIHPVVTSAGMLTSSALVMVPLALITDGLPDTGLGAVTWGALAYSSLAATALAYILYFYAITHAGAANASLVTLLIGPFGVLLGVLVRGETLGHWAFLGFALLALGLVILDGRLWRRLRPDLARTSA